MRYALIEDGQIKKLNISLPTVIGNVSVGKKATNTESYGLYPIVGTAPTYDSTYQRLQGPSYSFDGTQVNKIYTVTSISVEELQQRLIKDCEAAIIAYIQAPIDAYNKTHNMLFSDVHSCANYAMVEGYTHQAFCAAVWTWNVQVWEAARQILADALAGTVAITSVNDLLTLLPAWVE